LGSVYSRVQCTFAINDNIAVVALIADSYSLVENLALGLDLAANSIIIKIKSA
jgi:hypothetical protein